MTMHESQPPADMPPPPAAVTKTPSMVVWALVLSILGFCGITAIVGIVLGFVGRGKAKEVGKGVGMATAAIIIGAAWLVLGVIGVAVGGGDTTTTEEVIEQEAEDSQAEATADESTPEATDPEPAPETTQETPEPVAEETSSETVSQSNAVAKALDYLGYSSFSKKGLIEQLEFEGFSNADAQYAVDNITVDWKEQAALKAEEYLNVSPFSRSGLIEQLEFEGFTRAQATYGVDAVGL